VFQPASSKMATYPPTVVRFMLDFVDQHKGPNNIYEKDLHGTIASMTKLLNSTNSTSKATQYGSDAIRNCLSKFANEFVKDQRLRGIRALWQYGSDILDLSRFKEGTYDANEISANQSVDISPFMPQVDGPNPAPVSQNPHIVWTADKVRVLLDELDSHRGSRGLLMTNRQQAFQLICSNLNKIGRTAQSTKFTPQQVEGRFDYICNGKFQKDGNRVSRNQLFLQGKEALNWAAFQVGTFTQHELNEWSRRQQRQRPVLPRDGPAAVPDPHVSDTDGSTEEEEGTTTPEPIELSDSTDSPGYDSSIARTLGPAAKMPDISFVKQAMANLGRTIEAAVLERLKAAKIDPNQPFVLNLEQLGSEVTSLLETLLFCSYRFLQL
jgi:hypothetical protein